MASCAHAGGKGMSVSFLRVCMCVSVVHEAQLILNKVVVLVSARSCVNDTAMMGQCYIGYRQGSIYRGERDSPSSRLIVRWTWSGWCTLLMSEIVPMGMNE